jgi:hypothetical protein
MVAEDISAYLVAAALVCAPTVPLVIMFVGDFRKRRAARVGYSGNDVSGAPSAGNDKILLSSPRP